LLLNVMKSDHEPSRVTSTMVWSEGTKMKQYLTGQRQAMK
jgi:hypothetical protein